MHGGSQGVTLLCFHGIGTPAIPQTSEEAEYWIGEQHFLEVLDHVVALPGVGLSFDDGYASDVSIALPALLERGLTATFFPIASKLGEPGFLTPGDVRTLDEAGMSIGTHGWTHQKWTEHSVRALAEEIDRSRECLYDLTGKAVVEAACPLGMYDRGVLRVLQDQGIHRVFTSDRAVADPDAWLQPRYSAHSTDTLQDVREILEHEPTRRERLTTRLRLFVKRHR